MTGIDEGGRRPLLILFSLLGGLIGAAIVPNLLCRPYRMRVVDNERGIIHFKCTNPQFTKLLAEQARPRDGVASD
jgi:hypothetical protein